MLRDGKRDEDYFLTMEQMSPDMMRMEWTACSHSVSQANEGASERMEKKCKLFSSLLLSQFPSSLLLLLFSYSR